MPAILKVDTWCECADAEGKQMNEDWREFWAQAISDSAQLVFALDRERRVVAVSAALAKALGREPSALVGCNCAGLMHKGGIPAECPLRDLLLDGGVQYAEVRSDALGRDLFIVAMPLLDGDRNIVGALHTAIDITERKRAEAELRTSEARFARAQEVGHVGSWEYDPTTTEFWGSAEARRIYGFGPRARGLLDRRGRTDDAGAGAGPSGARRPHPRRQGVRPSVRDHPRGPERAADRIVGR